MLNILWQILLWILSICGIVMLCAVCFVLLVALLIFFVPIRYHGNGLKNTESTYAKLKITWLFHLFRMEIQYQNHTVVNKIKLFFFCLYDSSKPPKEKNKKKPKDKKKDYKKDHKIVEEIKINEELSADKASIPISSEEKAKPKEAPLPWYQRILQKFKNIIYTIRSFCAKMRKATEQIDYYLTILQAEDTQKLFATCKALLFKAIKSILPRKIRADLIIGTGSPDTTGYLLAVMGMLYPYLGNNVSIEPDFEQMILEGSLEFKGRIFLCTLVIIALRIYRNKGLRSLIRKLKREET